MQQSLSDPAVFEKIFRQQYQSLCRYIFLYVRNKDQAEDIVQEVFAGLWVKKDNLAITGAVEAYLRTSCRNAALNYLKRSFFPEQLDNAPENPDENAHRKLESEEADLLISDAIGHLPTACRTIYLMVREEGLSYAQIADNLNISKKTVENQMSKAISILKKLLLDKVLVLCLALSDIFKTFF